MSAIASEANGGTTEKTFESDIELAQLTFGEVVGKGNFASVYKGTYGADKHWNRFDAGPRTSRIDFLYVNRAAYNLLVSAELVRDEAYPNHCGVRAVFSPR